MKLVLSPLRATKPHLQAISVAILVLALQLICEVPLALALRAEAYLATQVLVGASIAKFVLQRKLGFSEFIGLGFALGSLVAMCIDQLFVKSSLATISWTFIPIAAVVILLTTYRHNNVLQENDQPMPSMAFIAFIVLLILVQERYWPLYIALSLLPFLLFNSIRDKNLGFKQQWIIRSILTSVVLIVGKLVLINRPSLWWIKTEDFQFFEALSYSLTHWGSNDQVFVQGQPVLYHWFSYAWMGLTTKATAAPNWIVQTKIAPVIVVVVIVFLVIALLQYLKVHGWRIIAMLMIFVLINDFNFESFSMVFSYIWLLAFAYFLFHWCQVKNWRLTVAASIMAAGALGAKSSNIAILVAGYGVLLLFELFQRRIRIKIFITHTCIFVVALAIVYFKLYFDSPYSATIKFGTVGIAQDFFGDVDNLPRPQFIFWSLMVLCNILLIYIVSMVAIRNERLREFRQLWQFSIGALIATSATLLLSFSIYEQEEYFLHSFVIFGSIILGFVTCQIIDYLGSKHNRSRKATILCILFLSVVFMRLYFTDDNSGEAWAIRSRIINDSSVLVLVVCSLLIYVFTKKYKIGIQNITALFILSALFVTVVSLNSTWFKHQSRFRNEVLSTNFSDHMIGTLEMQQFFTEAQRFIPNNAIVASNYVCDTIDCPASTYDADRADWTVGGEAMMLAIYLHRQLYISGYGYLWQNVELPEFAKDRLRLSIKFAADPSDEVKAHLVNQGVKFFILDKSLEHDVKILKIAKVLATSKRFQLFLLS